MKYYVVDAFTDEIFKGNPAGVCLLEEKISNELMQKIAFENNLAETAFVFKRSDSEIYDLQWFTPEREMDLCGHATLASAYVIMNFIVKDQSLDFLTKSGILHVSREQDVYKMNLPSRMPVAIAKNPLLEQALAAKVLETHLSRDLLILVENEKVVQNLAPNFQLLRQISQDQDFAIIVTAKGDSCDFVSRFFAPNARVIPFGIAKIFLSKIAKNFYNMGVQGA